MTKKTEMATTGQAITRQALEALDVLSIENGDFVELSSSILKMEQGEIIRGYLHKEVQQLTDKNGATYECVRIDYKDFNGEIQSGLLADKVILTNHEKLFNMLAEAGVNSQAYPVEIQCLGDRQSVKGTYRDFKFYAKRGNATSKEGGENG